MHIGRADEIAMTAKAAGAARPVSVLGLRTMPTCRTPARWAWFGVGEAQDVGPLGLVCGIVDIFAVLPQGHALVMVASLVPLPHAMRVADEEHPHLVLDAEVDDMPCGSRIRRWARRRCLFLARCRFFQRRECFVQRLCFLASRPDCLARCRLRAPRPRLRSW